MKFLIDQDGYDVTVRFLHDLGHDVVPVAEIGMAQADDTALLETARSQARIFVSRDRDFGNLIYVQALGAGVIYLRILPSTQNAVHSELARVLDEHREDELRQSFVVIEPGRHRFRKVKRD